MSDLNSKIRITLDALQATRGLSQLRSNFEGFARAATQFATAFAGIQLGRGTLDLLDAYNGLTARLKVTTGSQLAYNQAIEAARTLSTQYATGLADTAKLLDRVYASIAPLGGTVRNATTATEALLAALKISGATAEESSSAILQFSQALGKGVLNGDEFNSINEAAPGLLRALGTALGKSTADLKKMGEQGTLTSDVIIKAATIALPALRQQAADIGPTIGGAFTLVNNAATEFIGKAGQANGTARIIAGGMKVLADNIGLVVSGLGLLTGAALLGGLTRLAAALPSLSAGIAGVGLAIRGTVAFITGPLGLVVSLGSLALAWLGVDVAQRAATDRTLERVKAERQRVQDLVNGLNAKNSTDQAAGQSTATAGRQAALDRNLATLRQLDDEIAKLEKKTSASEGSVDIRADGPLKAKLEENKGRRKLDEDYARDRELIETQSARKIAALRREGRNADADNLAVDAQQSLVLLQKTHDDAVKALSKDETNTRVAQYIAAYDRIGELVSDAASRELKAVQSGYDRQLLSTQEYFAQRGKLEDAGALAAIAKIDGEIAARQAVLAKNRTIRTSSVNEAATVAEANKREIEEINKLEIERVKTQRDLNDGVRSRAVEEGKATTEVRAQRDDLTLQIKAANDLLTMADERLRLQNQYADSRKRELAETGATTQTDELINARLRIAELERLKAKFGEIDRGLALQEELLAEAVDSGALSVEEAEKRKTAARAASMPQLLDILDVMKVLAQTEGEKQAIDELILKYRKLADTKGSLEKTFRDSVGSGFTQVFKDISTGAETAAGAVKKFISNIASSMLDVVSQRLGNKLLQSLLPADGSGFLNGLIGVGTKFFAGLFHTGGVVGTAGGAGRVVDPRLFALAPRYHSGGIAGLRTNEVPAILQAGEEVLTADDPRHQRNGGRAGNNISIAVSVTGAQGTTAQQRGGGDELGALLSAAVQKEIDVWATRQSRSGGLLAGRS